MKLVYFALWAFAFLSLNYQTEGLGAAKINKIENAMNTLGSWSCTTLSVNPTHVCQLVGYLQYQDICIQDVIDYLTQKCGWSCWDVISRFYTDECGCFNDIEMLTGMYLGMDIQDFHLKMGNNCQC